MVHRDEACRPAGRQRGSNARISLQCSGKEKFPISTLSSHHTGQFSEKVVATAGRDDGVAHPSAEKHTCIAILGDPSVLQTFAHNFFN
jgi:hypothetical protein